MNSNSSLPSSSSPDTVMPTQQPVKMGRLDIRTRPEKFQIAAEMADGDARIVAASSIHASLLSLYETGRFSDLTVTCDDRQFHVHKAIVCAQSPFFEAALTSGFKEGLENAIDLPDDDPDTLHRFFQFLYSGTYSDNIHCDRFPSQAALQEGSQDARADETDRSCAVKLFGQDAEMDKARKRAYASIRDRENKGEAKVDEVVVEEDLDYSENEDDEDDEDDDDDEEDQYDDDEDDVREESNDLRASFNADVETEAADMAKYSAASLSISLEVYLMAEKYNVPALKALALQRFTCAAETYWYRADDFPDSVDMVFSCTVAGDPLRELVSRLLFSQYFLDENISSTYRPVVERHADLAIRLLDMVSQDYAYAGQTTVL